MSKLIIGKVIEHFGNQVILANKLGLKSQNISEWVRGVNSVPLKHAIEIERLTKGKFKAKSLVNEKNKRYLK